MTLANIQRAVYSALSGDAALGALINGVHAEMPQPITPEDDSAFPFVTIGNDTETTWDSHTFTGGNVVVQIDAWSRSNNLIEVKDIADAIRGVLHYQAMTITGAQHVVTVNESNTLTRDPDGHTKRALCMYRIMVKEL